MTQSAGDNLHYRPPTPNSGGTCPPVPPWSTPMIISTGVLVRVCMWIYIAQPLQPKQSWGELRAPSYLRSCVTASADVTSRPRLRSISSQRYERQRTRLKQRSYIGYVAIYRISAWSLATFNFLVLGQEPGTVCRHHCAIWQTLALLNVIKRFFFNKHSLRYSCCV